MHNFFFIVNRLTYNEDLIKWCDVVVPCGGDGTFLLAASRVRDNSKPVIGFNSSPQKSVGRLCLPTWCSNDVKGALNALKEGKFTWMRRSRIRTTITCEPKLLDTITPVDLHTLYFSRYPPVTQQHDSPETGQPLREQNSKPVCEPLATKVLPFLALNEVFIGESVTSRVSLLRLQIDNGKWTHTKSSGLCVTTGTGSTSWHFSINCLRTHSVMELMKILSDEFGVKVDTRLEKAREVAETFSTDSEYLAYSVREYITFEEWPAPRGLRVRDRATSVKVKSHCVDAGLVIDGSVSFPFNDGTEALLEIHPEDTLMTVHMDDALHH
ncbi:NAD kinase 2, mitochondrial [Hyposmocoma kahamanoa]|uniref:NAD kinase 2, mitochondrial n=1 Tax=Hyposmocoma kahamanoa TaxID=1477025 RepID=UPI000E6D60BF|nr:NAD kinase 2, mitochondrial [Hyposmocoma kahamanoa]